MHRGSWREMATVAVMVAGMAPLARAEEEPCAVEARLHWIDMLPLASFAAAEIAAEAAGVLARHGVCATVAPSAASAVRTRGEIAIVLLPSVGAARAGQRVMGAAWPRHGGAGSAWVYFDEVTSALGLAGRHPATWSPVERSDFARAIGRVVAHEVLHVLLPGRPHDRSGLMSASLGRRELTGPAIAARPELLAAVRQAMPAGGAANRSWTSAR